MENHTGISSSNRFLSFFLFYRHTGSSGPFTESRLSCSDQRERERDCCEAKMLSKVRFSLLVFNNIKRFRHYYFILHKEYFLLLSAFSAAAYGDCRVYRYDVAILYRENFVSKFPCIPAILCSFNRSVAYTSFGFCRHAPVVLPCSVSLVVAASIRGLQQRNNICCQSVFSLSP